MSASIKRIFRSETGFTLVELLVVIAVLGILAGIAVPRLTGVRDRAYTAEALSGIGAIKTSLEMHQVEKRKYPASQKDFNTMAGEFIEGYSDGTWEDWEVTFTLAGTPGDNNENFSVALSQIFNDKKYIVTITHTAAGYGEPATKSEPVTDEPGT